MQLRRYQLVEGAMDGFLEWFPTIRAAREQYGFKVEFLLADRENNQIVWAVSHPGDFDAAFETFASSPERAAAFEGQPKRVEEMAVSMVDPFIAPGS
ncbi:MAG: hypothetical protein OEY41_16750 [Acidimicrobiia bacterium]|nr:hypothetical protein [Acidimicrobiia bacterium]MDH4365919.1 hypothetical protein [Acidimicrobiia bacterium]MDH5291645.1 hypothetical protein [Acidimicrobiia bacterium]